MEKKPLSNSWHLQIVIPEFKTHVVMSPNRRAEYHKKGETLSKRMKSGMDAGHYHYDKKGFLVNTKTGDRVLKNPRAAGTPKLWKINGQQFTTGMHHRARSHIFKQMKRYLAPFVNKQCPVIDTSEPIAIWMEYFYPLGEANWDLDNVSWPWFKWMNDTLKQEGKYSDDNVTIIQDTNRAIYREVSTIEERKLIFHIQPAKDVDPCTKNII